MYGSKLGIHRNVNITKCEVSSGRVRFTIMKDHDMLQAYERLTGLQEAPKFILKIDIIQHCKLVTWRAYFLRDVDEESDSEISYYITHLYISESGDTVPMRGLINLKG